MNNAIFLVVGLLVGFLYGYLKRDIKLRTLQDRVRNLEKWEKRNQEDAALWKQSYDECQRAMTKLKLGFDPEAPYIHIGPK